MEPKENRIDVVIDKNAIVDDGEGTIRFSGGLTLSDDSTQMDGTKYDIPSMDISRFDGTVLADHDYSVQAIVGKAFGVAKSANRLVAEGVMFAIKQSSLARFVYDMVRGGFINAVSIGTVGPWPGEDNIYRSAALKEWSFVALGNNENATIVARNAIKHAEADGLDTKELKDFLQKNHVEVEEPKIVENSLTEKKVEEIVEKKVTEKLEAKLSTNETTMTEEEKKAAEAAEEAKRVEENKEEERENEGAAQQKAVLDAINTLGESLKGLSTKVDTIEKNAFDQSAKEPEFKQNAGGETKVMNEKFAGMSGEDITRLQVQNFYKSTKNKDAEASKILTQANEYNKNQLIEKGFVKKNAIDMETFGNFVTNPELLTEIQGYRTDFSQILSAFPYRQTNSLQMGWLVRDGDIDMQPVEMCDDGANGNLKPISEYEATANTKNLEELAAVTPICTAATIFLAADLLTDASQGYRNSYDRNKARGIIAALEKAAEDNDPASFVYAGDLNNAAGAATLLGQIRKAIFEISQGEGMLVMNEATFGIIWNALFLVGAGGNLTDTIVNGQTFQQLWLKRLVVVPNELMPTLGDTATYKTYAYEGATVTINHAMFYVNPMNVRARENGSLRFDLSTEAAYEVNGVVRSAYQRNEIVLRGSQFRGTAVLDPTRVGSLRAGAVIS